MSEYINRFFLSLPQESTIPKIYIINKKKINQLPYDSVSIKVGIILSEKWTFLQTWIYSYSTVFDVFGTKCATKL